MVDGEKPDEMRKVLVLTSIGAEADRIVQYCRKYFADVLAYNGDWGDPLPAGVDVWNGDLIISYCCRWILPDAVLQRARRAINFHPAPPTRRGAGGINWALYEGASEYGVTCHEITERLDAGPILSVRFFPVLETDDVDALYRRTHKQLEKLALKTIKSIAGGAMLKPIDEQWSGTIRTRRELDSLSVLSLDHDEAEIRRRIRATLFGDWRPSLELKGWRFILDSKA